MGLLTYPKRNTTSKSGINHVRVVVESSNSIFHEVHQENDIGVDAIIEIIKDEHPTGKMVALQIKSGESFFVRGECIIPIKNHAKYWSNHHLPMFGIVYVPSLANAYWVDIKKYISENEEASTVKYLPTKANTFDAKYFKGVFVPNVLEEPPNGFSFADALELFRSTNYDESFLGLIVLFREYADKKETWDEFLNRLRQKNVNHIPKIFPHFLAHIPQAPYFEKHNKKITSEVREYGKKLFESLGKSEIIKLLSMIDEQDISRGSVGLSVETVLNSLPQSKVYLSEIISDIKLDLEIRENAATIFAYKWQLESLPILETFLPESTVIDWIIYMLREAGDIYLYD